MHKSYFYQKLNRIRFNIIAILIFVIGIIIGSYLTISKIIPTIFATSQTSISYSTDTQFNTGTMSSTQVSGSGSSAVVELNGGSTTPAWYNINWNYRQEITINYTQVTSSQTNFPVLISINSDTSLATYAQSNGNDILFTSDDGITKLNHEIEQYNTSTGQLIAWVNVPSLSSSTNTILYMYYGNSNASNQQNTAGVWDSNYSGIWHLPNGTNLSANDSTSNANNGTIYGVTPTTGKIGGAGYFNGSSYIEVPNSSSLQVGKPGFTFEAWVNPNNISNCGSFNCIIFNEENSYEWAISNNGLLGIAIANTTPGWNWVSTSQIIPTNQWTNLVITYDGSYIKTYINGTLQNTITGSGNLTSVTTALRIGARGAPSSAFAFWYGSLDEIRISSIARSSSWISTAYNNENSPSSFFTLGSQETSIATSGYWESPSNSNTIDLIWNGGWGDGSNDTSTAFSATVASVNTNQTITFEMKTATSEANLSTSPYITLGTVNSGTTFTTTAAQMNSLGLSAGDYRYLQVEAIFSQSTGTSPQLDNFTIYYTKDNTPPETNASSILMYTSNGGRSISQYGWDNSSTPYFSWTAGSDSQSGMKGYCLYLGTSNSTIPSTSSSGNLNPNNSPISASGTGCEGGNGFITSSTSIDLSTSGYLQTQLTTSTSPYYLGVAAVDNEGNIDSNFVYFTFYFDNTIPNNVSYISCPGGNFSNVTNMSFSWPTSGSNASSSIAAPILGWQYQINSTSGTWNGPNYNSSLSVNYIPSTNSSYTLTSSDSSSIIVGDNIIYFRTIDEAGNISSYRTCSIAYGGQAPIFPIGGQVLVTPNTSNTNTFSLSWPSATATTGQTVADYYYMVNNTPPSSLATLQENGGKYINNGTSTEVSATVLSNAVKGTNTVYVVAIDNSATPNYSPSNYISGTFTLNSNNPDPVSNLVATDSSIKVKSQWNVTLTWSAPSYQGAGNLTYLIYRSTNDINFTEVGTTIGLSYVDNTPESTLYYYYIITQDGASELSDQSTTVSITPTGRYTSPASIETTPTVTNITDNSATISWSTDRNSDSKIEYGKSSGNYYTTEPYVPTQVTEHVVTLTNLSPSTTYYYKAIWTDSDGNTGTSTESTFTTNPPPEVSDVSVSNITLNSAYISFSISNAVVAQIQYGPTTSFGGSIPLTTSPNKSPYTEPITGLSSGTQYYYRIAMTDPTGNIYYSDTYNNLITPPTPEISKIEISAVSNSPEIDVFVQWSTNTATSSVISYGGKTQVDENFISGEHQAIITNLSSNTKYSLTIKVIDKYGNQVTSSPQIFTTGINKVPPKIVSLNIQTQLMKSSSGNTQIIISWTTDKPSTSQVEYGEGTGTTYSQKSTEDNHYVINHVVVISNLPTARIYHIKAISVDSNGNVGYSSDNITITPQATESALNLVLGNLEQVFGFLGNLNVSY